jgi:integrase
VVIANFEAAPEKAKGSRVKLVLSPDEIRGLFAKVPKSGLTTVVQRAIWIILSSGTRVGETVAARWSDVNLAERTWFNPADNTKSGTAITIALSDFALRHFQAMWDASEQQDVQGHCHVVNGYASEDIECEYS